MVSKVETNPRGANLVAIHALLQDAFAYMADRIDPPSSLTRMTLADLSAKAEQEDLFLICEGTTPVACLFGAMRDDTYHIGKLAVAQTHRGQGLARALVEAAATRAQAVGQNTIELQSRVELTENHATFAQLGFLRIGEPAHPGYTRPTSYTFRRALSSPDATTAL